MKLREAIAELLMKRVSTLACREAIFAATGDSGDRICGTLAELGKLERKLEESGISLKFIADAEIQGKAEARDFICDLEEMEELAVNGTL